MKWNPMWVAALTVAVCIPAGAQSPAAADKAKLEALAALKGKLESERRMLEGQLAMKIASGGEAINLLGSGPVVLRSPYSAVATSTSTQTLADGNRIIRTTQLRQFRDSEGRTRREQDLAEIGPWKASERATIISIHDPVANFRYTLHPEKLLAEKISLKPDSAAAAEKRSAEAQRIATSKTIEAQEEVDRIKRTVIVGEPKQQTGQRQSLGDRNIEGVTAHGTRLVRTISAGEVGNERPIEIVSESWWSEELQLVVLSKRSDPRVGETEYRLTQVQRGEQPRHLFELPANYTVREQSPLRSLVR